IAAIVGSELASGVHLRSRDVSVDVDPAGHHDHPASIDPARLRPDIGDHLPVLETHVAQLAVDVVGRIVDAATPDPDRGHPCTWRGSRGSSAAAVGARSGRGAWSVSGTPSSRWAVPVADTPVAAVWIETSTSRPSNTPPSAISLTPPVGLAAADSIRS